MLRITKQTDYGIVLLSTMALEPEVIHTAAVLAADTQLPLPTVSKILKLLARERLLVSHRGARGGYGLARAPQDISVAAIIGALEGPIAMTECIDDGPGACQQEPVCPQRANWQVINQAVREALERLSLRHMTQPMLPKLVQLGGRAAG